MIKFTVRTEIARPPADVFGYVTDPAKLATLQTNTISAVAQDDKPIGVGTCVREVHRAPGGKELASLDDRIPDFAGAARASASATLPWREFALCRLVPVPPLAD